MKEQVNPKSDEGRLLKDEEIGKILSRAKADYWTFKIHPIFEVEKELLKAQDAKTASIYEEKMEYGESVAESIYALKDAEIREIIDTLKNYGISITNEGILAPYSDEWDYLYDTPRRVLLRGNDKGESARKLWLKSNKGGGK